VEGVIAAVVLVLVGGALVGNLYASRRRRRAIGVSVYRLIQDRIDADRAPPGSR
jgi:hypothetical protein